MKKEIWYAKNGSAKELIGRAILMARVTGSIGATESEGDETTIFRSATVRREGHQEADYYLYGSK